MKLPRGELVRSRTARSPGAALATALESAHTGYLLFEPADALLGDDDDACVLALADGVPTLAYHTGTECGGAAALADVADAGPYHVDCYAVDREAFDDVADADELAVRPGAPATQLADDQALAERTRTAAPDDRTVATASERDPVEAFLADEERLDAIRSRARSEARRKAEAWDLTDALEDRDRDDVERP